MHGSLSPETATLVKTKQHLWQIGRLVLTASSSAADTLLARLPLGTANWITKQLATCLPRLAAPTSSHIAQQTSAAILRCGLSNSLSKRGHLPQMAKQLPLGLVLGGFADQQSSEPLALQQQHVKLANNTSRSIRQQHIWACWRSSNSMLSWQATPAAASGSSIFVLIKTLKQQIQQHTV